MAWGRPEDIHPIWRYLEPRIRDLLEKAMRRPRSDCEEFLSEVMLGPCPYCGSDNTLDCLDIEGLEAVVGLCRDCGYLWCPECYAPIVSGDLECGHWAICEECGACEVEDDFESDEDERDSHTLFRERVEGEGGDQSHLYLEEESYILPWKCEKIRAWLIEEGFFTEEDFREFDRAEARELKWLGKDIDGRIYLRCAWCGKDIKEREEVHFATLQPYPGLEFDGEHGVIVPLPLAHSLKTVYAVLVSNDLIFRKGNKSLLIITCSTQCMEELREAARREREFLEKSQDN